MSSVRGLLLLAAGLVLAHAAPAAAHEIPRSAIVQMLVKPDGHTLRVLIRAPLASMRDIEFPEREGFLDIPASEPALLDAVVQWILPELGLYEDGRPLSRPVISDVRISLPSDRSFESFERAAAHMRAPVLPGDVRLPWDQALLDAALEYEIGSDRARFALRPGTARLGVDVLTVIRFADGDRVRAFEFRGDPGVVQLDPRWHQAALHFVRLGFLHILDGVDHLLFLACLVIPLRRLRPLVVVVSAFTLAHSVTLVASALDYAPAGLWFPPLVEFLIAASIVYMAIENIVATPSVTRRAAMAFGFGLVHGFGFSFALKETLQFAGSHLLLSLLSFNAGVELGQLLVLAALVPAIAMLFRAVMAERTGTIVLSAVIAHTAWHWMTDRWATLRVFDQPSLDAPALLTLTRIALALLAIAALTWLARLRLRHDDATTRGRGDTTVRRHDDAMPTADTMTR